MTEARAAAGHKSAAPSAKNPNAPKASNALQKALHKMGLVRDMDLALHLPLRYEDETRITPLAQARAGSVVQIEATVTYSEVRGGARRMLRARVEDGAAECMLTFFRFHPAQQKMLAAGARLRIYGELRHDQWGRQMLHPGIRAAGGALPQTLTPVYPSSAIVPQAYIRKAVAGALARVDLSETLPPGALPPLLQTMTLCEALHFLHHPAPDVPPAALQDPQHPVRQRLKAEELLAQQLSQYRARAERAQLSAPCLPPDGTGAGRLTQQFLARLPFALTGAQERVVAEIRADMQRPAPMQRLLQGDVGAGKTVVAALAALACIEAGWQCALMAPTEILAAQHFGKLVEWLTPLLTPQGQSVAWLAGAQKKKERAAMLQAIADGTAALVIGTHAVIQERVQFHQLALAVIDEQHRFGVAQRLALRQKMHAQAIEPHVLMMSATPIPRTLAMSYYADLDVSTLDELPPGRTPVTTRVLADTRRAEVIARIAAQVQAGRQVYWVCPLIEESEALDLSNATATHADLCAKLPGVEVGLLHSRLAAAHKSAVMAQFAAGQMGVLVATTVIEVGVDVPNATLMVVEHAERFGLSQLHQLRGRVGRGAAASACVLLYGTGESGQSALSQAAKERLRAMRETGDGFEIARRDLQIRGPGEFLGARQSGAALLRFADLEQDSALLHWARALAPRLLTEYPHMAQRHMQRWLGGKEEFLKA